MNIGFQKLVDVILAIVLRQKPANREQAVNVVALTGFMMLFLAVLVAAYFMIDSPWIWVVLGACLMAFTVLALACLEVMDVLGLNDSTRGEAS